MRIAFSAARFRLFARARRMAIEAVKLHGRIVVARTTEVLGICDGDNLTILALNLMAVDAALERELLGANALVHRLVALMLEGRHVIAAHPVGRRDALVAAALGWLRWTGCSGPTYDTNDDGDHYGHHHRKSRPPPCHVHRLSAHAYSPRPIWM